MSTPAKPISFGKALHPRKRFKAPIAQRLERRFRKPSDIEWEGFRAYLLSRYHGKAWALELLRTARKHYDLVDNLSLLDSLGKSRSARAKILQSLIALSKYRGFYEEFRAKIKAYGIKWKKPSSLEAFSESETTLMVNP